MTARRPDRVSLLWCPVCGHNDRYVPLKEGAGRHYWGGRRCPGEPQALEYRPPRAPEPLPTRTEGAISAAVAVEVAIRPGLDHLGDGPLSFVGRVVQYRADDVETLAELAGLVLRDIAADLPDAIAPAPRPAAPR